MFQTQDCCLCSQNKQMPSIIMNNKIGTCSVKEKSCLGLCKTSCAIFKKPSLRTKATEKAVELDMFIQKFQDDYASPSTQLCSSDNGSIEAAHDNNFPCNGYIQYDNQMLVANEHTYEERLNHASMNSTNMKSIFSPSLDSAMPNAEGTDKDFSMMDLIAGATSSCSVPNFSISDMITSTSEEAAILDEMEANPFHDYKCAESSLLFDVGDDSIPISFLDESNGDALLSEDFDPHSFFKNFPESSEALPVEPRRKKSVTLVLDLDETLVHSTLEQCGDADFTFSVLFNTKEHRVYVKQRPHLRAFLARVADLFQLFVFTASQSVYAEQLLDVLDPHRTLFSKRIFRDSCVLLDGSYTKDLSVLGVDLAKVAILDNSPQVFRLQKNNGIPIKSWFSDADDCALISLLPFLETLADADDVRPIITRRFGNRERDPFF